MTRQHVTMDQVKAGIDNGSIRESVVLDTYAAYEATELNNKFLVATLRETVAELEAMKQERDIANGELVFTKNDMGNALYRAEAAEETIARLTEALKLALVELREAECRQDENHACLTCFAQAVVEAALSASSTPDSNSKTTTMMRAADPSALSGGQDLREKRDANGSGQEP